MADYIDRKAAKEAVHRIMEPWPDLEEDIYDLLDEIPSADVVEVVTCENCKNSYDTFGGLCCSRIFDGYICPSEDFSCMYGEKKGGII